MKESAHFSRPKRPIFPSSLFLSLLIALLLVGTFALFPQRVAHAASQSTSAPPKVNAPYAELYDLTHNATLTSTGATTETEVASTTKIMTALLVINSGKLNSVVTITQADIDYVYVNGASSAGLVVNDRLTVQQLLSAMMLPSGCDAAFALAGFLAGNAPNFIARMNAEAAQLGLKQTYYTTVDGLHNPDSQGHFGYSTASDLIHLTSVAMQLPLFRQVVATQTDTLPVTSQHHAYTWSNTNELLGTYPGILGVKTGTTPWAGYCLVFAATRNGVTLLGVVLSSPSDQQRYSDATALLNWGFSLSSTAQAA